MFSIEKLSRNCSSFEELIASKLNLNYIHNIAKAITPRRAASSPYLIIWWRQTDVMMPRWIVHEKQLCCFNSTTGQKLPLKSRATLPPSWLHRLSSYLAPVFRYSIDRSSFLRAVNASKLFKDEKKPAPFSPGQKYIGLFTFSNPFFFSLAR